jgi:hypothetical protein
MSQDIEDTPNPRQEAGVSGCSGWSGWSECRSGRVPGGLVVAAWVEGEVAQELAGGGVNDADVEVLHEHHDVGSGVGPADADVVEPAAVAEGDGAGGADDVGADAVVGVGGAAAGGGLGLAAICCTVFFRSS